MKVLKFGGTSMANAQSIKCVSDIIKGNKANHYIVVSAPGKREKTDTKVTDMLYAAYEERKNSNFDYVIALIKKRFDDIISALNMTLDLSREFDKIKSDVLKGASREYMASRGEYLAAILLSSYIGAKFVDSAEFVRFDKSGAFLAEETNSLCESVLKGVRFAVIPGFYGVNDIEEIKTFSRGGSDVSGAIVARAVQADVYENWTDVDGFMTADPRIVDSPRIIEMLTYKELRELSYMGANVLHPDSIFPVRKKDICINIKNTFNPEAKGTMIVPTKRFSSGEFKRDSRNITGIAGKKNFVAFYVEKSMMNNELGFARKILSIFEEFEISVEHMPSGIDTLTVVAEKLFDDATLSRVVEKINNVCHPDHIEIAENLALIAVVGHGMSRKKGTASRVCTALYKADINIRMIDQGSSELNIIVAVENNDYENAIKALYNGFEQ